MKKLVALGALFYSAVAGAVKVTEVKVRALDGFGGDLSSVVSRCQTKVGSPYDAVTVTRDVTSLKDAKEFEEISADAERQDDGVAVTFYIKRKFRYRAPLVIKGGDFFSISKLASEAGLKDGYLYGEADLAEAAARVRSAYLEKGFGDAKVTPVTELLGKGNDCTVTLLIDEGLRQKIHAYLFEGVTGVDEAELHEAIGDLPWWNPFGWFAEAPVTTEKQLQCVAKLQELYRNYGFLDVEVAGPERRLREDGRVDVCFRIEEGRRYTVGSTKIVGLTRYPEEVVRAKSMLPAEGAVAGEKDLHDAAHRIEVAIGSGDSGLADTRVEVRYLPSDADPTRLDIVFAVAEGVPVVIDNVIIRGNDYTKDKVIRREIALGPGDRMLADRAERSQRRLEHLDYFSRVNYKLVPSGRGQDANGAEYRDLVYEVEEKNTGSFMVGLGASSVDSIYVSAEVSQSNFDLFAPQKYFRGGGQKGRLYVAAGPRIQTYEASVDEPWFLDRLLELTVEGYRRQRWYDEYDIVRNGAAVTLAYPVKFWPGGEPFGRLGFRLSGEFIQFEDVEDDWYYRSGEAGPTAQLLVEEEQRYGDAAEGVLRVFWNHDNRNDFRLPSRGGRTQIFADLGGGDNTFWRVGFSHRHYFSVLPKYRHVLMAAVRAETIDALGGDDEVPIYNRMFLGGPRSVRGIEYRNVAPMRKAVADDWIPWGGQTLFCANLEYTIPIVKMLRFAVFSDLGSVGADAMDLDFADTFAWTVGIGFRLDIQMFPIRIDFAKPIEKPDESEEEVFSFTIGYDF